MMFDASWLPASKGLKKTTPLAAMPMGPMGRAWLELLSVVIWWARVGGGVEGDVVGGVLFSDVVGVAAAATVGAGVGFGKLAGGVIGQAVGVDDHAGGIEADGDVIGDELVLEGDGAGEVFVAGAEPGGHVAEERGGPLVVMVEEAIGVFGGEEGGDGGLAGFGAIEPAATDGEQVAFGMWRRDGGDEFFAGGWAVDAGEGEIGDEKLRTRAARRTVIEADGEAKAALIVGNGSQKSMA